MFKTGKKEKLVHLGLRLPKSVHRVLVREATEQRRSLNDEVVFLIETMLKKAKRKAK